jgi:hypothetical protein
MAQYSGDPSVCIGERKRRLLAPCGLGKAAALPTPDLRS